jgi:hypothetical protein
VGIVIKSVKYDCSTWMSAAATRIGLPDCFCWVFLFFHLYGIGTVVNKLENNVATKTSTEAAQRVLSGYICLFSFLFLMFWDR